MAEFGLGPEVRALVASHLASMDHVEVLLLLCRKNEPVTAAEIFSTTGRPRELIETALQDLTTGGLLSQTMLNGTETYKFDPQSEGLRSSVNQLETMYNERPVTLVRAVYERPAQPVLSFADAFRLRRDE